MASRAADASRDPLIGQVLTARIERVDGAVFLKLPEGQAARLEWGDSVAASEGLSFEAVARYRPPIDLQVFVYQSRSDRNGRIYFVHERWARDDPWTTLDQVLAPEDRVTGAVIGRVPGLAGDGYLVQLDTSAPVCTRDGEALAWDDGGLVLQPDIRVLVRAETLPSADGDTRKFEPGEAQAPKRLVLKEGERVAALVTELRTPPHFPLASVLALLHAQDAAHIRLRERDVRGGAPTSGRGRHTAAQALPAWDAEHRLIADALAGRRVKVIDNEPEAHSILGAVLRGYGAQVTVYAPSHDQRPWHESDYAQALAEALQSFDLLLLDDGLPSAHDGERLLARVRAQRPTPGEAVATDVGMGRIALMSANTEQPLGSPEALLAVGVVATLRRPLAPTAIAELLSPQFTPRWEWQPALDTPAPTGRAQNATTSLQALLKRAADTLALDYVVLLEVLPGAELRWLASAGQPPFAPAGLPDLAQKSVLRELALGLESAKVLSGHTTSSRSFLHPQPANLGQWRRLALGREGAAVLLGMGSTTGHDPGPGGLWFAEALRAEMHARHWQQVLDEQASALSAGWLAQGFAHEQGTRQEHLAGTVKLLAQALRQAGAGGGHVPVDHVAPLVDSLARQVAATAGLSLQLLKRQRARDQALNLQSWAQSLMPALAAQCKERDVALHAPSPPDLTLAVPEQALTVAVTNLVLNAAKHHYRRENRWVRLGMAVAREGSQGKPWLHVDVRDNGPGIDVVAAARLFEPGWSFAPDAEERHGIGLWLSRTLLARHGGRLTLEENWRGLGARFRVALPVTLG